MGKRQQSVSKRFSVPPLKSLLIFVHYNREKPYIHLPEYVKDYVKALMPFFTDTVISSNYKGPEWNDVPVMRFENLGYDFGFFYQALQNIELGEYERIAFVNDSNEVIRLGSFNDIFEWANQEGNELWGLTDNDYGLAQLTCHRHPVKKYHIQSHFLVFEKKGIECLESFFEQIRFSENYLVPSTQKLRTIIVDKCEVGLTQFFIKSEMKIGSYFSVSDLKSPNVMTECEPFGRDLTINNWMVRDITINNWKELVDKGYPLIKRKIMSKTYFDVPFKLSSSAHNFKKTKSILYLDQISSSDSDEEFNRTYDIINCLSDNHNVTVFPLAYHGKSFDDSYIEELQQSGVEVIHPSQQLDFDIFAKSKENFYDIIFIGKPHNLISYREKIKKFFPNAFLVYDSGNMLYGRQMPDATETFPTEEDKTCRTCHDNSKMLSCAVIITCHNYENYLVDAIESVLNQTVSPVDILVVDDASDDNPKGVVDNYPNVRYERVEHRCPNKSRGFGFLDVIKHNPNLAAVAFLDCDNCYHENYLETGLPLLLDSSVAIVYPDLQFFGNKNVFVPMPEYNWETMISRNIMDASSIIKRDALEQSEFWKFDLTHEPYHEDWMMCRKILKGRWRGVKNPTPLFYRDHNSPHRRHVQWEALGLDENLDNYDIACLYTEDITIFIPFSGRKEIWEETKTFLENQSWPHSKTKIIFCDTSSDEEFEKDLKSWLFSSDYEDVHYYKQIVGDSGLANKDRRGNNNVQHHVNMAMAKIYNNLLPKVSTEYLLIVEDDNIPEYDCAEKLLRSFTPSTFSVSAPYTHHFWPDELVVWNWEYYVVAGEPSRKPFSSKDLETKTGAEDIGGNGFGTVMLKTCIIKNYPFSAMDNNGFYDVSLYAWLSKYTPYIARVNWDVVSNHLADTNLHNAEAISAEHEDFTKQEEVKSKSNKAIANEVKQALTYIDNLQCS